MAITNLTVVLFFIALIPKKSESLSKHMVDSVSFCPKGWFAFDSICYLHVYNKSVSRYDADQQCRSHGARLLQIWRSDEWTYLSRLLKNFMISKKLWTSLYKSGEDWIWSRTGYSSSAYTLKETLITKEPVCAVFHKRDGKLHDTLCSAGDVDAYICKTASEMTYLKGLPWNPHNAVNISASVRSSYYYPGPKEKCQGRVVDATALRIYGVTECAAKCLENDLCQCFRYKCLIADKPCARFSCHLVVSS